MDLASRPDLAFPVPLHAGVAVPGDDVVDDTDVRTRGLAASTDDDSRSSVRDHRVVGDAGVVAVRVRLDAEGGVVFDDVVDNRAAVGVAAVDAVVKLAAVAVVVDAVRTDADVVRDISPSPTKIADIGDPLRSLPVSSTWSPPEMYTSMSSDRHRAPAVNRSPAIWIQSASIVSIPPNDRPWVAADRDRSARAPAPCRGGPLVVAPSAKEDRLPGPCGAERVSERAPRAGTGPRVCVIAGGADVLRVLWLS